MTNEAWMVGYLDQVQAIVAQHGHAVQIALGDSIIEHFTYTVGLTPKARPELWIGSLSIHQAGSLLNDLVRNEPPDAFVHGALLGAARWTIALRIRGPVDMGAAQINVATCLYPDLPVSCLQLLWPDPAGLYPDNAGYDQAGFPQRLLPLAVGAGCWPAL